MLQSRLALRKFLGEEAAHAVGCRFGLGQFCKEGHNLSFDDALKDRIRLKKGLIKKPTGENQFTAIASKLQRTAKYLTVFRSIRRGRVGKTNLNRNKVRSGCLSGRDQPTGENELRDRPRRPTWKWQQMTRGCVVTTDLTLHFCHD